MTILRHELRQGKIALMIWTGIIGFMLAVCVFLYPEMKGQMEQMNDMFASMGAFTDAFGMDQLDFGTLIGYYAIECGNVLGLGGAFFAAICGAEILSKEEKDKTAEFLLTHPVSRKRVVTEKLVAVVAQITAMDVVILALAVCSMAAIGEKILWKELCLLHLAYYLMMLELAWIGFGVSAVLRKGSIGVGLGVAALMYVLNLVSNITESAEFLKYITPFGFCEGADIISEGRLDGVLVAVGMTIGALCIGAAYWWYGKKDIR